MMFKGTVSKKVYYASLVIISILWAAVFTVFATMTLNEISRYTSALSRVNTDMDEINLSHANDKIMTTVIAQLSVIKHCVESGYHITEDEPGDGAWLLECEDANVKKLSAEELQKVKAKIKERIAEFKRKEKVRKDKDNESI